MSYTLGIDIGSTTLKAVVQNESGQIVFKDYQRHFSKVREKTTELLHTIKTVVGENLVRLSITGSAGLGVAKAYNLPFVQEVFATAKAVDRFIPGTDVVVELGGEDAKILFFKGTLEERMNGSCAGGTGAFIDQMAVLLGVTPTELDVLSEKHEKIYSIASRCGVFAKSDIQPLLNQGAKKEDIAASIFQCVVDQTIAGLAAGRRLEGKIAFLGGPLFFFKGLRQRFVETLKLKADEALFPEDAIYFVAKGAAIYAEGLQEEKFSDILDRMEANKHIKDVARSLNPLFESEEDYTAFQNRHSQNKVQMLDAKTYEGDAYIGIDAGSTTTKIVLITPKAELLYTFYSSNFGNPLTVVEEQIKKIYELFGDRITIKGSAVTGYGEELLKNAFNIDVGLVETIAHYNAAKHFKKNVDFIIDIG
jgi:predicted CoA-substrate-specific enzyme activase